MYRVVVIAADEFKASDLDLKRELKIIGKVKCSGIWWNWLFTSRRTGWFDSSYQQRAKGDLNWTWDVSADLRLSTHCYQIRKLLLTAIKVDSIRRPWGFFPVKIWKTRCEMRAPAAACCRLAVTFALPRHHLEWIEWKNGMLTWTVAPTTSLTYNVTKQ